MSLNVLTLDGETTTDKLGDKHDNSPMNPNNKCVGMWFKKNDEPVQGLVFYHAEKDVPDDPAPLIEALKWADVIVCHNAKFDIMWLTQMGFEIPPKVFCTMIAQYIYARGQIQEKFSLEKVAEKRNVTRKKSELVSQMFKDGTGFDQMPLHIVDEYAIADVQSTYEIYLQQVAELELPKNKPLKPIFDLMNEMLMFLVEIETNGIRIDRQVLSDVEVKFKTEKAKLENDLSRIIEEVMGDTPINLNSGADMTKVVYSRQVIDRKQYVDVWNIGLDARGKPKMMYPMSDSKFARYVRETTQKIYRTVAHCCTECSGSGRIRKIKKDGTPFKQTNVCPVCTGEGALYVPTNKVAGLKLSPVDSSYVSINGFKTNKETIKKLLLQARNKDNLQAVEFLSKMTRLNAVSTYLDSFIKGIQTYCRDTGLLHSSFNQTTTATGRLSSTNPNFQNLPKGNKFEVRRAIVSRFGPENFICEADFIGLEFRVAGELSRDPQIIEDVLNGKDVHSQTASIIHQKPASEVTKDERGAAKAMTFQPLYGGMGKGLEPHLRQYFDSYFDIYKGLAKWHSALADEVLEKGYIQTPSGRQFAFPNAKRLRGGRVSNHTQLVNYPCQSFATADAVPLACIRALRAFKERDLKSKIILSVHDSIVCDVVKEELPQVKAALKWAMVGVADEMKERFNYDTILPLDIEIAIGPNWMEIEEISVD